MKNTVTLVGFAGNNPETRETQSGAKVASLSLATSRSYKDAHNKRLTETSRHRQAAVVTQMHELKTAADSIEARLFEFHRRMLAQVRSQYE